MAYSACQLLLVHERLYNVFADDETVAGAISAGLLVALEVCWYRTRSSSIYDKNDPSVWIVRC